MNPKPPYILSGPARNPARHGKLILLALCIVLLAFLLLALDAHAAPSYAPPDHLVALSANAAPPYPIDRKTQDYYQCRYVRHEATSRLCIQFRPHRGAPAFKPKN